MGKKKEEIQRDYRIDIPTDVDLLGYEKYSNAIASVIKNSSVKNTPLTIGIFGSWGSGKSSFLKLIEKGLNSDPNKKEYISFTFNAWKYEEEDYILAALVQLLLDQVCTIPNIWDRFWVNVRLWFRKFLWKSGINKLIILILKAIGFILFLIFVSIALNTSTLFPQDFFKKNIYFTIAGIVLFLIQLRPEIFEKILSIKFNFKISELIKEDNHIDHISFMDKFRDEIQNIITIISPKKPIVIYIDDLDRCMPTKTIYILEIIKKFLDIEGLVFVISADSAIIEKLVDVKYRELFSETNTNIDSINIERRAYFEKLVQLPFLIPPILPEESKEMIRSLYLSTININDYSVFFDLIAFNNPRRVKRIFYLYTFYKEIIQDLNSEIIFFKLLIIQNQYQSFYDSLINSPNLLSDMEEFINAKEISFEYQLSEEDFYININRFSDISTEKAEKIKKIFNQYDGLEKIINIGIDNDRMNFTNKNISSMIQLLNTSNIE